MNPDPLALPKMAKAKEDENYRFRAFLKHHTRLSSGELDRRVSEITDRVWKKIDCTACANCCRVLSPTLTNSDVERLAGHLGMSDSDFAAKYLKPTENPGPDDAPWLMRERPCPFLKDNRCSVYEHRPESCRAYPYLHKPKFTSRTLGMIGRLSECPIVFEVWAELKRETGFRNRHR